MRARSLRPVSVLFAIVLLAPTQNALAFHDNDTPLLFSGTSDRPLWVSYLLSTDGAKVVADIEAFNVRPPLQAGVTLYDAEDKLISGFGFTGLAGPNGLFVDATPVPGQNIHIDLTQPEPESPIFALGVSINDPAYTSELLTGNLKLLLWMAGTVKKVDHSLRGEEGVEFLASKTGTRTFVFRSQDFTGLATAGAGAGGLVGARANVQTSKVVEIQDTFIGFYYPVFTSVDQLSEEGPSGVRDCPCFHWTVVPDPDYGDPATAGTYTFRDTGVGVAGTLGEIILGGADARLPEEADLQLVSLEALGTPTILAVGEQAEVTLRGTVTNHGRWAPMDAELATSASADPGATAEPAEASAAAADLRLGEVRAVEQTFTVGCTEPGIHLLAFDGQVRPSDPADDDPNPANNGVQETVTIECVPG